MVIHCNVCHGLSTTTIGADLCYGNLYLECAHFRRQLQRGNVSVIEHENCLFGTLRNTIKGVYQTKWLPLSGLLVCVIK